MKLSPRYASHLPVLVQALGKTSGPVLELGMGAYSTPILDAICELEHRPLTSIDNDWAVVKWAKTRYNGPQHEITYVRDWADTQIEKPWGVALVDHSPGPRRKVDIARLADYAGYIIIHDSNGRYNGEYDYASIYPLFKYKLDWAAINPSTTVLSNFNPLDSFWDNKWKTRSITF